MKADGLETVADGLEAWTAYWRDAGTDERFIPHPTTFLNQRRYGDPPPTVRAGAGRARAGDRSVELIEAAVEAAKQAGR